MIKTIDVLEKIGDFLETYTGSSYNYTEPTVPNSQDYTQIGEVLGYPVYIDNNDRYETEFLSFPTLSDILQTLIPKISFSIARTDCSVCLVINYNIPLIKYPPITICLAKPECGKEKENKDDTCISEEEYKKLIEEASRGDYGEENPLPSINKPICKNPEIPYLPPPGEELEIFDAWILGKIFIEVRGRSIAGPVYDSFLSNELREYEYYNLTREEIETGILGPPEWPAKFNWRDRIYELGATFFTRNSYDRFGGWISSTATARGWQDVRVQIFKNGFPIIPGKKPKETPIPDPPSIMDCCEDIQKLLARIEKKVDSLVTVINPQQFKDKTVFMPANWLYPTQSTEKVVFQDLPDLIAGVALLIDRRIGFLPQRVEIKDADPLKEGDQGYSLTVNSLADMARLTLEYLITANTDLGAGQMINAATLYEAGITHQVVVAIESIVRAIADYLDFEAVDKKIEFPLAFNPQEKPKDGEDLKDFLPRFLKPIKQPVEATEWAGGESLKDKVNDILKKVSLAAAAVTETRPLEVVVDEIMTIKRGDRLLNVKEAQDRLGVPNLKEFFDDSEKAYPSSEINRIIKDKPYGFSKENEPKFRKTTKGSKHNRYKKVKKKNQP